MDYQQGFRDGFIAGMAQSSMAVSSPPTQAPAVEGTPVRNLQLTTDATHVRTVASRDQDVEERKHVERVHWTTWARTDVKMAHAEAKKGGRK